MRDLLVSIVIFTWCLVLEIREQAIKEIKRALSNIQP